MKNLIINDESGFQRLVVIEEDPTALTEKGTMLYNRINGKLWLCDTASWREIAVPVHNHDGEYYVKADVDALLAARSLNGHTHDVRYYTQSAVDSLLAGKSDTTHTHTTFGALTLTGQVALSGDGRIYRDIWMDTNGLRAPGTKPAAEVTLGIGLAWEFTDGTDDTLEARIKLPDDMDRTAGMKIYIGWCTPTGSAGNCRWQVEYLFRGPNEAMNAAADATLADNFAASATGYGLAVSLIGTTAAPAETDVCLTMRIKRRADEVADTLGEDNYLLGLCAEYVSNKLGTAI